MHLTSVQPACADSSNTTSPSMASRPAWMAVGVAGLIGVVSFMPGIILLGLRRQGSDGAGYPRWALPDQVWQQWAIVALICFVPLLVTALVAIWLAAGDRPSRARQAAGALCLPTTIMVLCTFNDDPSSFFNAINWRSDSLWMGVTVVFGTIIGAAVLAWFVAWLILAVAAWQPPSHLVRRPLA